MRTPHCVSIRLAPARLGVERVVGRGVRWARDRDARAALTGYLVVLFLVPAALVVGPLNASTGTPANLLALAGLLWWACARLVPSFRVARGWNPIRFVLLVFVASALLAYVSGAMRPLARDELHAADDGLVHVAAWAGVALVTMDMLVSRRSVERLLRRLVVLCGILAGLGVVQFFTGIDIAGVFRIPGLHDNGVIGAISERSIFRRVAGTASHPIEFGVVLAMVFPLALHFAFIAGSVVRRRLTWLVVILIAMGIPMSLSRSAIVGVAAALLLVVPTWSRRRQLQALVVVPLFAMAMRLVVPGLLGTIKSLFTNLSNDPSIQGRTDDYAVVGQFISQSPWVGRGFGTFLPSKYVTLDNQYLGSLVEVGIVGFVALLLLVVVGFFTARGVRLRAMERDTRRSRPSTGGIGGRGRGGPGHLRRSGLSDVLRSVLLDPRLHRRLVAVQHPAAERDARPHRRGARRDRAGAAMTVSVPRMARIGFACIHAHPTLAEAFHEAVLGLNGAAIHMAPGKR